MSDDARLARLAREEVDPELRPTFDAFVASRGKVPNLFRVAAHRPAIAATLAAHLDAVMGPGEVPMQLKELISVRVSTINGCEY
jgi:alkylhydroperoxidase family enzyme